MHQLQPKKRKKYLQNTRIPSTSDNPHSVHLQAPPLPHSQTPTTSPFLCILCVWSCLKLKGRMRSKGSMSGKATLPFRNVEDIRNVPSALGSSKVTLATRVNDPQSFGKKKRLRKSEVERAGMLMYTSQRHLLQQAPKTAETSTFQLDDNPDDPPVPNKNRVMLVRKKEQRQQKTNGQAKSWNRRKKRAEGRSKS